MCVRVRACVCVGCFSAIMLNELLPNMLTAHITNMCASIHSQSPAMQNHAYG